MNVEESTQSTVIITRLVLNKMCFAAVVKQLLMLLSGDPRVDDVVVAVVVVLGVLSPPVLETLDSEEEDCETQSSQENCQTREECER